MPGLGAWTEMKLNYEIKMTAILTLDENWIDDDAIKGLTLKEIKELCMELLEGDRVAFFEDAGWSISVEHKPPGKPARKQ